jgi:hypothetical protein
MAIDVQLTLPLPRWTEENTRLELKKILSLPVVPRVTDEVFMPGGVYLPVGRVRRLTWLLSSQAVVDVSSLRQNTRTCCDVQAIAHA